MTRQTIITSRSCKVFTKQLSSHEKKGFSDSQICIHHEMFVRLVEAVEEVRSKDLLQLNCGHTMVTALSTREVYASPLPSPPTCEKIREMPGVETVEYLVIMTVCNFDIRSDENFHEILEEVIQLLHSDL